MTNTLWRYGRVLAVLWMAGSFSLFATAETLLWGGRPEFGIELEEEKSPDGMGLTHSITYIPALVFPNGPINRFDLLLMGQQIEL